MFDFGDEPGLRSRAMELEGTFARDGVEGVGRRFLVGGLCFGLLMGGVGCGAAVADEGSLYNQAAGVEVQKVVLANLPGLRVVKSDGLVGFPGTPGDTSPNPGADIKL